MICYDIRFPEMSRILAGYGADVLIVPSAWVHGILKEEHWQTMLKARAIENGSFVIAPDQVGNIYTGRSMIIDPFGVVLLDMGNREGMEIVEIDISRVRDVIASLPPRLKTVVLTYTEIIWIFFVRTPILKKHCLILIDISSDNQASMGRIVHQNFIMAFRCSSY